MKTAFHTRKRKNFKYKSNIHSSNPAYLGITFNAELRFGLLITKIQPKGRKKLAVMKCSLHLPKWNPTCLKTTYQAMVRPCFEYAVPVWTYLASSNLFKLYIVQNHATGIKTGTTRSTPIQLIEFETDLLLLWKTRDEMVLKYDAIISGLKETLANHDLISTWQRSACLKHYSPENSLKISYININLKISQKQDIPFEK